MATFKRLSIGMKTFGSTNPVEFTGGAAWNHQSEDRIFPFISWYFLHQQFYFTPYSW